MESLVRGFGLVGTFKGSAGPVFCAGRPVCLRYLAQQTIEWDNHGRQPFRKVTEALGREVIG